VGNLIILGGVSVAPLPVATLGVLGAVVSVALLAGVAARKRGRRKRA
jgi:hypothetical protein